MPFETTLIISTIVVIVYTMLGGLLGDVITDTVQGAVLIIGLIILLVAAFAAGGGAEAALGRIESRQLTLVGEGENFWARLDVWAVPIIGSLVSQAALARLLAAKSPEVARRACFAAFGLYLAVGMIPVMLALTGVHLGLTLGEGDAFLPSLAEQLLPSWLFVIFMGALISAILSTVDSTLLTVAALWSHNIILPRFKAPGERLKVMVTRGAVVVTGIVAWLIASVAPSILDLVILADATAGGLVVVVLIGLYGRGFGGAHAALAAMTGGICAYVAGSTLKPVEAPFMVSLLVAVLAYCAVAIGEFRGR
jgi:Na+/proline symporter